MEQTPILTGWTKVDNTPIDDVILYVREKLATRNDITIMIGTDAVEKGAGGYKKTRITYLTVICFHMGRNGAHVIKRRDEEFAVRVVKASGQVSPAIKLNGEINRTSQLALALRENGVEVEVHLDVNPNESEGSFEVYKYIKGYFESLSFVCEYKPDSPAASFAADYFL